MTSATKKKFAPLKHHGMSAVSFEEAWNIPEPTASVSAKQVAAATPSSAGTSAQEDDATPSDALAASLEMLIYEVQALRAESARRSTVYILFGSVACVLFFVYVEKLQRVARTWNVPTGRTAGLGTLY